MDVEQTATPREEAAALNHHPRIEASSKDAPLTEQPVWEMAMVQQQSSLTSTFHSIPAEGEEGEDGEEGEEEEAEDLRQGKDGGEEEGVRLREEEIRTVQHDYECVAMSASLAEELEKEDEALSRSLSGSVTLGAQPELAIPPAMRVEEQGELFDPQTLQTVVTGCEIPDSQRTTLEGSQVGP